MRQIEVSKENVVLLSLTENIEVDKLNAFQVAKDRVRISAYANLADTELTVKRLSGPSFTEENAQDSFLTQKYNTNTMELIIG